MSLTAPSGGPKHSAFAKNCRCPRLGGAALAFGRSAAILGERSQAKRRFGGVEGKLPMPQGLWSVILLGAFILFIGASLIGWAMG